MNVVVALLRVIVATAACYVVYFVTVVEGYWGQIEKFTLQSTILLAATMLWGAWAILADKALPPAWLEGGVLLYNVGAGAVYVLLVDDPEVYPVLAGGITIVTLMHVIVPIAAGVVWLLFTPHRAIEWVWALWWLIYLATYIVAFVGRGMLYEQAGYPYDFMNPDIHGWDQIGVNYLAAFGVAVIGGAALVAVDRALPERTPLSGGSHHI